MSVKFLRVIGIRANAPAVVVTVNDWLVKWHPHKGWECGCLTPDDEYECEHIMVVQNMLDPKVTMRDSDE